MLKEIFEKMGDKEWEYEGEYQFKDGKLIVILEEPLKWSVVKFSLVDLLANKSWCRAIWGEGKPLTTNDDAPWGSGQTCLHCGVDPAYQPPKESGCSHIHYPEACTPCSERKKSFRDFSVAAFKLFQEVGEKGALNYILKTMRK